MALFDSYEFLCLLCKKSEKLDLRHFMKLKFKSFFFSPLSSMLSHTASAEWSIFHMDRYSISVTVVYLLMCWRLKVGREDELAHRYYRLLREGMRRERGRGQMMTDTVKHRGGRWKSCLFSREKDQLLRVDCLSLIFFMFTAYMHFFNSSDFSQRE